jgi:hypothetical protein
MMNLDRFIYRPRPSGMYIDVGWKLKSLFFRKTHRIQMRKGCSEFLSLGFSSPP